MYFGEKAINSNWSYFEPETGHRVEGFYTLPDQRRVCYVNGRMIYGTNRVWGHQYDFNPVTGAIITGEGYDPQNGWYYIDETTKDYTYGFKKLIGVRYIMTTAIWPMVKHLRQMASIISLMK